MTRRDGPRGEPGNAAQIAVHPLLAEYEAAWRTGDAPRAETLLNRDEFRGDATLRAALLSREIEWRRRRGETPSCAEYLTRFPDDEALLERIFSEASAEASTRHLSADASSPAATPAAPDLDAPDPDATDTWRGRDRRRLEQLGELPRVPGYDVLRLLGRGGMGYVLQARDVKLDRLVAIKLPLPNKLRDAEDRERFLREARAAARLRHPGICPIYEIGESDGLPYLALAFIAGEPLSDWATAAPPSARRSAEIVAAIAEAVQAAHEQGVVHRDLKPGNVMIERDSGAPILMDFGLAKDQSAADVHLTVDGAILGTPAYMAPEQAAGQTDVVGPRSDVYGLGAILYWLLCRQAPFSGTFPEVIRQVQEADPVSPCRRHPGLHRDLETICKKAMAKRPQDRYETARALAEDLRRFANGEAIVARPEGWGAKVWRRARRRPATSAGIVAFAAVALVAVVVARQAWHAGQVRQAEQQFNRDLEAGDWSQARVLQLERDADRLESLDSVAARQARERLLKRLRDELQGAIQRPSLDGEQLERLSGDLAFLEVRDAEAAAVLRRELDRRLRAWTVLFDLRPPFDKLAECFDPAEVEADGRRMKVLAGPPREIGEVEKRDGQEARPVPPPSLPRFVPARIASGGNVELKVALAESVLHASQRAGIALNLFRQDGYQFLLSPAPRDRPVGDDSSAESTTEVLATTPAATTLGQEILAGRPLELQILRSGQVVQRQRVRIGPGITELTAQRQGTRLSCRVNQHPPLTFDDIFPLGVHDPGAFGLVLPTGAEVVQIKASRQELPASPSPLERGDFLTANRQFQEAIDRYREQEANASPEVRQEARVKQALCLLQLGRADEGAVQLEGVAGEQGDRWPIVAACHLWMLRLSQRRYEDAETIREVLASRYQFEQLASLLPDQFRHGVIKEYLAAVQGVNLAGFSEEHLRRMERVVETERLVAGQASVATQLKLMRGYRGLGDNVHGLRVAANVLDTAQESTLSLVDRIWLVEEYCWMLRLEGQASQALELVTRRLETQPGEIAQEWLPLLVERARILAALDRPEEATRDLDLLLARIPRGELLYRHYSAAKLLQGFLRADQGDSEGARRAWHEGLYREWYPDHERTWAGESDPERVRLFRRPPLPAENPHQFSGAEFVQFAMLGSLTGELSDSEAKRMFGWLMFRSGGPQDNVAVSMVSLLQGDFVLRTFRGLCQTERGRQVARGVAFQSLDFAEVVSRPIHLMLYEIARQGAFASSFTPEQDEVVWRAARTAHASFLAGKVPKSQLLGMTFTWKGQTGAFGWDGVASGIDPALRGYMAYLFGHRMLQLKQPADAAKLFRTAVQDAAADEQLREQAESDLGKLAARETKGN